MKKVPENIEHEEVILSGMLAEFRIALLQEIDAASRSASSSAVPLINGKRIAQVGSSYQYIFDIESALNLPGDAPGDLYVPGHSPLEVVVISIDGMAITLSIPENLGAFVPSAHLRSNLAYLMRKLIDRIESKADTPNLVGDRILGAPVSGDPVQLKLSYLNSEQNKALGSSLGRNTTFIWGPPGTGKTLTIGAIGEQLYHRDRSVLVVSHTNIAVDGAIKQIGERLGLDSEDLAQGKVIRVGEPKDLSLNKMPNLLLKTHVDKRSAELSERRANLESSLNAATAKIKEICKTIDICEWVDEAEDDITSMTTDLYNLQKLQANLQRLRSELFQLQDSSDYWNTAQKAAHDANSHLIKLSRVDEQISKLERQIKLHQSELNDIANRLSEAKSLLAEVNSVGWLTRKWRRLPSPEEQSQIVEDLQKEFGKGGLELDEINRTFESAQKRRSFLYAKVQAFRSKYSAEPAEMLQQVDAHATKIKKLKQQIRNIADQCASTHLELKELFEARLLVLKQLGFTQECSGSLESMLDNIKFAFRQAVDKIEGVDLQQLQVERDRLNAQIRAIEAELAQIEEALKKVEQLVIADAMVVATTLTRAYLRDSIQFRRFDTVILDEASMAPIPALWVAASLAEVNAIVVGDHKQLPPIVLSTHELAKRWLGTDIFNKADIVTTPVPHRIDLKKQHRMHPDISRIPNEVIYGGVLEDADDTVKDDELASWYRPSWGHDSPVLLIDTGSLNAWVTSVPRGRGSSRLNFLSATVCVDLAEQLLLDSRPEFQIVDNPRILIACPYSPHAKLLRLMLSEQDLDKEVRAGTVHSFQGSEASIVIFDMVNDEPHWRVAMFIPEFDEGTKRLLNVALTRARRRLIVVGDFEYIAKHSKKSFFGSRLIPFLRENYLCVDALDVVKVGLAARAAKAQTATVGGEVELDSNRLILTQEHFYDFLRADLARAQSRVVMYSPFITQNRLAQLEPQIRATVERGTMVYVVTKAQCDRSKRELSQYRMLERALTEWGVVIVHKQRMHEKLIFIDSDILWEGSLNPLSFSNTGEHMERRVSQKVFEDYARTLHLNDLIGEYHDGLPICPICESEVVACEGRDEPFFWRCVEKDCYTRSIDQPPLQGGVITCATCAGDVEYGEWGGKPAWRCIENRHHHQKVARTHLRLPKMRAIVPKRKLRELDKHFGISSPKASATALISQQDPFLFELK